MISIKFVCDLCGKKEEVPSACSDTVKPPKGWVTRGKGPTHREHYGKDHPGDAWCSMQHRTAFMEAEEKAIELATEKGREVAQLTFKKELRKLCLAAHSAVEALGNVIAED
jgi:hypothetical protein